MKTRSDIFQIESEIKWQNPDVGIRRQIMGYDGQLMMVKVKLKNNKKMAKPKQKLF